MIYICVVIDFKNFLKENKKYEIQMTKILEVLNYIAIKNYAGC